PAPVVPLAMPRRRQTSARTTPFRPTANARPPPRKPAAEAASPSGQGRLWSSTCLARMPQGLNVAFGRRTEDPAVLAAELRGAFVADVEGSPRRVQALVEHQALGLAQAQPFLILQRAHRRELAKMVMQTRWAHLHVSGEFGGVQRPDVIRLQPRDRADNPLALAAHRGHLPQACGQIALQQPVVDLALDQG